LSNPLDDLPLPPGNRAFPLLGETLAFLKDAFAFVASRVEKHGPVFRTHLLGQTTVILAGPQVSDVFLDQERTERDGSMPGHVRELFGGRSLPLLDGDEHRARKQQVLAAFVRDAMPGYLPAMQAIIEASLAKWAARGEISGTAELQRLAITVIANNMVGIEDGADLETLLASFKAVTSGFAGLPVALPGAAYKRALKARDAIFAILRREVGEHRAKPRDDGLGRILAAKAEDGSGISDEDAARELHHVFIAGYIVFAELAALLERLVARPEIRAELSAEVQACSPSGPITARVLASMPLLDRVVQETKRITPVVPIAFGRAKTTFEVAGYRIPKGTMLFWAPWNHDQDRGTFPDPGAFDPARFSDERAEHRRHPNAFAPQGMGPDLGHVCPGIDYATLFMATFAVAALRDWSWSFPEQDLSLDFGHLPPEHADGLRVAFRRERATSTLGAGAPRAPARAPDAGGGMPTLGADALMALASVIWADGTMADEEATALVRIARAAGLTAEAIAEVERATRQRDAVADAPLSLDGPAAEHVYSLACLIAASDGTIDPREREAVTALGDRLGLDDRARTRASLASHAVAQSIGVSGKALAALAALAAEMERGAAP
jgi:cytochrome P450